MVLTDLEKTFVYVSGNITAVIGNAIHIPCKPPVGIPPVDKLSWLHDGQMVQEDNRTILRHRNLTIRQAEVGDSGFYQCVADNGLFERISDRFYVNVIISKLCNCDMELCNLLCHI